MLAFDHLVHAVGCTPKEVEEKMKELGFHTVQGGEHTNWGTWNSLCYFDLSYIEFLAVQHEDKAKKADNPLVQETVEKLQHGEGMLQIALRTNHIEELAVKLAEKGLQVKGPFEGKRMRNDGHLIEWKMLFVEQEESSPKLPFFIQWEGVDEDRRGYLQEVGVIAPHRNGVKEIQTICYAVKNIRETVERWKEILEVQVTSPEKHKEWNALCQSIVLKNVNIQFCEPIDEGFVQEQLFEHGEYPFAVELQGMNKQKRKQQILGSLYIY
ncbi:VOC family protein [Bacillus sp. Xin]|uniref:VOC family protein n=1 Tax=unclassified Bacillus (in: firmicutes) TaxID=185979 RepID=UPI0015731B68|nr:MULTISPECIES: VOC family protein [unclassified Bacillus (in: firmicutes)]MBC6973213.1 VOC family protein [Bacillus sp. Xin]NSW36404.1 VOC family protein [Bacillus sp. Xin1]